MNFSLSPIRATCLAQFVIHSKIIQNNYVVSKNDGSSADVQMVFPASCYETTCIILLPLNSVLN